MKILLFGGSFDPPHRGHKQLLLAADRIIRADLVYLIPAFQSPLKIGHRAPPSARLRMTELWRSELPAGLRRRTRIERFELNRKNRSFTFETLRHLRRRHPDAEFHFLLGSDAFASLPRWKRVSELRRRCGWIVGRRPGVPTVPKGSPPHRTLPGVFPDISSTGIRARLIAGMKLGARMPTRIMRFIELDGLYGISWRRELFRTLSPERYRHTLAVARFALQLAERHGLDAERAATAALLHDAGRRFDLAQMTAYANRHRIPMPRKAEIVRHAPLLQHAYISEDLARSRFAITDRSVLSAIRHHTLGAPRMAPLDRLLYVADSASSDRRFPEVSKIRGLAERDLDAALHEAARVKLRYAGRDGGWLHPETKRFARWAASL